MKVYLIPGLGYNPRIFEQLALPGLEVEYVTWIDPLPKESVGDYAERMLSPMVDLSDDVVLIGHSMGGMVAQDFASRHAVSKVIIISSRQAGDRMPFFFKLLRWFRVDLIFSRQLCVKTVRFWGKPHGFTSPALMDLFKDMMGQCSNTYLKWALYQVVRWKAPPLPPDLNVFQIHGTDDRTIPAKDIAQSDVMVQDGSHILVYKRPEEVAQAIMQMLR